MSKATYNFNMKLAKVVEQYPMLYNFNLPAYSKRDALSNAWENVGNEMNTTAQECKEAWRLLRITYTRSIKLPASGSAAKKLTQKTQNMIKEMDFIRPYVNAKNNHDLPSNLPPLPSPELQNYDEEDIMQSEQNLEVVDDGINENNDLIIPQPTTDSLGKKKKNTSNTDDVDKCVMEYIKKKGQPKAEESAKKLFLLSLLPDLELMNDRQMRRFRTKVSEIIDEILSPIDEALSISSTPSSLQSQNRLILTSTSASATEQIPTVNWYTEDDQYACNEWQTIANNPSSINNIKPM